VEEDPDEDVDGVVEEEGEEDDDDDPPDPELALDPSPGNGPVWSSHDAGSGPSTWFSTSSNAPQGPMTPKEFVSDAGLTKMLPHATGVVPL
jgi:hypothetical protein